MKYYEVKAKLGADRVFTMEDVYIVDRKFRRQTLYDWESDGRILKLRNQRYIFSDYKPIDADLYVVANKIYFPSYVSLELALNHYGVIPEAVLEFTSITTMKTSVFENKLGRFSYRSIKPELFFGYNLISLKDDVYKIATLEKSLLDFLYLHSEFKNVRDFDEIRFNKELLKEELSRNKLTAYLQVFRSKALEARVSLLLKYLNI